MIKVADYIVQFMASLGIRHVFTVAGAGNLHILDALRRSDDVDYVCNHHEQASAMAMYAHARATGGIGACLVTTGPGGTNAITGVCSAWVDSVPGLVISGQVKLADTIGVTGVRQRGIQEINIVDIVRPVTKYAVLVASPDDIRYELEKAVFIARSGRPGPVWLDVPLDVQAARVDPAALRPFLPESNGGPAAGGRQAHLAQQAAATVALLNKAKRPVLLAGHGIRMAGAADDFRAFVERLGIPALITWNGIDLLESDHPLYVGRPGIYGQRGANFAIQNSDFLLAIGTRLSIPQTGYDYSLFARAAAKVYVDIDPTELNKFPVPPNLAIQSDAKPFLEALAAELERSYRPGAWDGWRDRCRDWRERYPVCLPEYRETASPINVFDFIDQLGEELAEGDIILPTASGSGFTAAHQALRIKKGQRCFTSNGFAEMGFDLPGAIGACFGFGGRRVVTFTGDGGIQMNLQELQTIVHHKLPIKVFVLSNRGYLTIRHTENALFNGALSGTDPETGVSIPDMVKIGQAYGLETFRIAQRPDMRATIRRMLDSPGPALCDVVMAPDQPLVPKTSFRQLPDGRLVSPPIEDLYPFLDREEFRANMIVPPVPEA